MFSDSSFDVAQALNALKEEEVLAWVKCQLDNRVPPDEIAAPLSAGLEELGIRFAEGRCFIPELILGGEIFRKALDLARPALEASGVQLEKVGTFLIGTVKGDLHDLGKNLVSLTLATGGFEVVDLGRDVPTERVIEEANRLRPDIVGLSALLTTTMEAQREFIEALEDTRLRDRVRVIVGGAPVNQRWADEIGADAYAVDAIDALRKARALLRQQ